MKQIKEWVNECINGHAGLRSFIERELLGACEDDMDMVVAGAEWILKCLVQPHGKEILQAVIERAEGIAKGKLAVR